MFLIRSHAMTLSKRKPSHRRARERGFTLIELMVVVTIIATVGALGAVMLRGAVSSAAAPSFARSLITVMHAARHAAITTSRTARVRIVPAANGVGATFVSEGLDPADATKTTWQANGTTQSPVRVDICDLATGVSLATATPGCPIGAAANTILCFSPNGRVNLTDTSTACPGTGSAAATNPTTGTGATLYFRGVQNGNQQNKYKIVVWGLTGLPKLIDSW
jgi:prepilin-type N-terminal cleavage/methylation domain-containing protein